MRTHCVLCSFDPTLNSVTLFEDSNMDPHRHRHRSSALALVVAMYLRCVPRSLAGYGVFGLAVALVVGYRLDGVGNGLTPFGSGHNAHLHQPLSKPGRRMSMGIPYERAAQRAERQGRPAVLLLLDRLLLPISTMNETR